MADQAITALPKKTYSGSSQIASTDYLLGIDSAEGYQMLIQDLGEYIINRATASLAGSTQTLASAISALNSKSNTYIGTATGSTRQEFVQNLVTLINSKFPLANLANGTVLTGSATWSGKGHCGYTVTRNGGGANIAVQISGEIVSASINTSNLTISSFTDLNSKIDPKDTLSKTYDLNSLDNGIYTFKADSTHVPVEEKGGTVLSLRNNFDSQGAQMAEVNNETGFYYRNIANHKWGTWVKLPTRAEVDALNSNLTNTLKSGANNIDNLIVGGYSTGSGNYFDLFVPLSTSGKDVTAASVSSSTIVFLPAQRVEFSSAPTITVLATTKYGVRLELSFPSTQNANVPGTVYLIGLTLTCS